VLFDLLQICQRDKSYDSYVEMPIFCRSSVANFTYVTAAALVSPGKDLTDNPANLLLVAAFHSHSPGVTSGSALCVFMMSDVRARAADNVRKCHSTSPILVGTQFYRPGAASQYCIFSQVTQTVKSSFLKKCVLDPQESPRRTDPRSVQPFLHTAAA